MSRLLLTSLSLSLALTTGCLADMDEPVGSESNELSETAPDDSDGDGFGLGTEDPPDVDLELMADNIMDDLRFNVLGFSSTITHNGRVVKRRNWGWAKASLSDGFQRWDSDRRMQVASVTKTLAAIATLKLLAANGLSPDSPIAPWLPEEWTTGDGWTGRNGVTFRHLLTHTSGVDQAFRALRWRRLLRRKWGNDWDGLRFVVSRDVVAGSTSSYRNANFALLRVLLPKLWAALPSSPYSGIAVDEETHGALHVLLMREYVFKPAGVRGATCWEQPRYPAAYAYNVTDLSIGGRTGNVSLAGCGAHAGWHLSADNLARVLVHLRHDDGYMPPQLRLMMNTGRLGWNESSNTNSGGRQGKYWHAGDWFPDSGAGRQQHACIMTYPGGIEATLLINSQVVSGKNQCTVLKDAYNNAVL